MVRISSRTMAFGVTATPWGRYLILALPIWLFLSWSSFNFQVCEYSFGCDYWEHSATLNAWLKDFWNPGNPHLATTESSARYMPFYALVTIVSRALNLDALQAMGLAGIANSTLLIVATPLFANRYFRTPWAGQVALIVFLCGWGVGWYFSNVYQLRDLLLIISYPSTFAFALALLVFWLALGILRAESPRPIQYAALMLLVGVDYASHPLTGAFLIVGLLLLCLFEPDVALRNRFHVLISVCIGAVVVEAWPFFSTWEIVLGIRTPEEPGSLLQVDSWIPKRTVSDDLSRAKQIAHHPFYKPSQVLTTLGPSLLGLPVIVHLARARKQLFIVAGAIVMIVPWIVNLFFPIPLGHRFLLYAVFFLQLAVIWAALRGLESPVGNGAWSGRRKTLVIVLLGLALVWNIGLAGAEILGYRLKARHQIRTADYSLPSVAQRMRPLAAVIPEDAVVMAPLELGWPLPTFTGKVVGLLHDNPLVADHLRRRRNTKQFFGRRITTKQKQLLLRRYDVTHILFDANTIDAEVERQLNDITGVRTIVGRYVVVTLTDEGPDR